MSVILAIIFISLVAISKSAKTLQGDGDVYFAHSYSCSICISGIRMIYRPEDYEEYSGSQFTAKVGFEDYGTRYSAEQNYYDDITSKKNYWFEMNWSTEGSYYYVDDYSSDIDDGNWISFAIAIYDENNEVVYQETDAYYEVQTGTDFCEIDESAIDGETKCSDALVNGPGTTKSSGSNRKYKNKSKKSKKSKTGSKSGGKVAGWIVFVLVIIAIAGALYFFCWRGEGWSKTVKFVTSWNIFDSQPSTAFTPSSSAKFTVSDDIPNTTVTLPVPAITLQTTDNQQIGVNLAFGYPPVVGAQLGPAVIEVNQESQSKTKKANGRKKKNRSQRRIQQGVEQAYDIYCGYNEEEDVTHEDDNYDDEDESEGNDE